MRHTPRIGLLLVLVATSAAAQKIKTGYEKGADFSQFKTYTWAKSEVPITRPLLYQYMIGTVDSELKAKGLAPVESNGDLTLVMAGSMDYGSNLPAGSPILAVPGAPPPSINGNMWIGANVATVNAGTSVETGTLVLQFVDRAKNEVVWIGTVKQKLDTDQKEKSMQQVDKAITKLLAEFPPKEK